MLDRKEKSGHERCKRSKLLQAGHKIATIKYLFSYRSNHAIDDDIEQDRQQDEAPVSDRFINKISWDEGLREPPENMMHEEDRNR